MSASVGDRCRVTCPLRPTGVVEIDGHRRDARAVAVPIDAGAEVVIVGWDTFGVLVRPTAEVPDPARLPGYGKPVPTAAEMAAEREVESQKAKAEELEEATHEAREVVALVGLVAAGAAGLGYWLAGAEGAAVGAAVVVAGAAGIALKYWLVAGG